MADSHKHHHDHHHDNYRGHKGGRRRGDRRDRRDRRDRKSQVKALHNWNMSDEELAATPFGQLGLSPRIVESVLDMGYTEPTPVQAQAIPEVLAGHDVMAAAQTGTGKTAAFLLPGLDQLPHANEGEGPLMLVVTPTRELAQQIEAMATSVCARTHHKAATVVGGVSYNPQRAALERGCDLLVATPGRLIDLMEQGVCHLDQVQTLVLDEADRMLDMGFLPDMQKIVEKTPSTRQTMLFSATLDESVLKHTRDLVNDPVSIEISHRGTTAETVEQYVIGTEHLAKASLLVQLLQQEGSKRVIVFTNSKHRADTLAKKLEKSGITCDTIHGDRSQHQRMMALDRFAKGKVDVLVATDVLSRGIDVPDVSYVVNFDVPFDDPEDYIHRVGRTGRAGELGWAVTFVTSEDYLCLRYVEQILGKTIPPFPRTEGLDLGDDPFEPDPDRNPDDKLPSKKGLRRKLKRQAKKSQGKGGKKERRDKRDKNAKAKRGAKGEGSQGDYSQDAKPLNRKERRALENAHGASRVAAKAKSEDSWAKFEKHPHKQEFDDFDDRHDRGHDDHRGKGRHNKHERNDWNHGSESGRDDRFESDRERSWSDDRRGHKHSYEDRRRNRSYDSDKDYRGKRSNRGNRSYDNRSHDNASRGGRHFDDRERDYRGNRRDDRNRHGSGDRRGAKHGHARLVPTNSEAVYRPGRAKTRYSRHPGDHGHSGHSGRRY